MAVDIATLGLRIESKSVDTATTSLNRFGQQTKEAETATGRLGDSFDKLEGLIKKAAAALGLFKLADMVKDAMMLAARYETLGVTMSVIGNNAGYTASQMSGFQAALEKTGISAVESRQSLALMGQAQIDFSNSSKLARIAQDAAVVGNVNSSEAFNRMITGIATGQTILLHHLGLMTNFETAYIKAAHAAGKTTNDLTEHEKAQIRVNEVIRSGVGIQGAYEAAMGTAGKQITSLARYFDNLKVKIGEFFQSDLTAGVGSLTTSLKFIINHIEEIKNGFTALIGIGASVYFARLASSFEATAAAQLRYIFATETGNAVTLGSAQASAQKAAAMAVETGNIVATTAAQEAYWLSELATATALKERLVIEAQSLPVGVSRASNAQRIAVANMEVVATETMLAGATEASSVAIAAHIAATEASTVAMGAASVSGRIMTGVMGGLETAMGLLGGPIGVLALAVAGLTYAWIKCGDAAEEARSRHQKAWSESATSKLVQAISEKEKLVKQMTQSDSDKVTESNQQLQTKMAQLQKEKSSLERQIAEKMSSINPTSHPLNLVKEGFSSLTRNLGFNKSFQSLDDLATKLQVVKRDIERVPQLSTKDKQLDSQLEVLRAAKNKQETPEDPIDPEHQARYDKQLLDSQAALANQYREQEKAAEEAALKERLALLSYEKDTGLKTTQEYLQAKYDLERAAWQKELDAANAQSKLLYKNYSEMFDKPGSDDTQTNAELTKYVKSLEEAEKIVARMNSATHQLPRDNMSDNLKQSQFADQAYSNTTEAISGKMKAMGYSQEEVDVATRIREQMSQIATLENQIKTTAGLERQLLQQKLEDKREEVEITSRYKSLCEEINALKSQENAMSAALRVLEASGVQGLDEYKRVLQEVVLQEKYLATLKSLKEMKDRADNGNLTSQSKLLAEAMQKLQQDYDLRNSSAEAQERIKKALGLSTDQQQKMNDLLDKQKQKQDAITQGYLMFYADVQNMNRLATEVIGKTPSGSFQLTGMGTGTGQFLPSRIKSSGLAGGYNGSYATGTTKYGVPKSGVYLLHQGETVNKASDTSSDSGVTIGNLVIHTQATNANELARDLMPALKKYQKRMVA